MIELKPCPFCGSDYIKRTDLIDAVEELLKSPYANPDEYRDVLSKQFHNGVRDALRLILEMAADAVPDSLKIPSADVRGNVHGRYEVEQNHDAVTYARVACSRCSVCGFVVPILNFCGYCGADMRTNETGGKDDDEC